MAQFRKPVRSDGSTEPRPDDDDVELAIGNSPTRKRHYTIPSGTLAATT